MRLIYLFIFIALRVALDAESIPVSKKNFHVRSTIGMSINNSDLENIANDFYSALLQNKADQVKNVIDVDFYKADNIDLSSRFEDLKSTCSASDVDGITVGSITKILLEKREGYLAVINVNRSGESQINGKKLNYTGTTSLLNVWLKIDGEWKVVMLSDLNLSITLVPK